MAVAAAAAPAPVPLPLVVVLPLTPFWNSILLTDTSPFSSSYTYATTLAPCTASRTKLGTDASSPASAERPP